jgi:hypothetical protein
MPTPASSGAPSYFGKQGPIDIWSPAHFAGGLLMGAFDLEWYTALGISVGFELVENTVAELAFVQRFEPTAGAESYVNQIGDVFVNMTGFAIGRALVAAGLLPSRKARPQERHRTPPRARAA